MECLKVVDTHRTAGIGLADRDRFELSGDELKSWIEEPQRAKEILLRNQLSETTSEPDVTDPDMQVPIPVETEDRTSIAQQLDFVISNLPLLCWNTPQPAEIQIRQLTTDELSALDISAVISSLGFEERTLYSNRMISKMTRPHFVHLVRYPLDGYADEIIETWKNSAASISETNGSSMMAPEFDGLVFVDASGLTKPWIFGAIRNELLRKRRVIVGHASATTYYPLAEDLDVLFSSELSSDPLRFLESLANVLKGEKGPYKEIKLLEDTGVDPLRGRGLIAFASSKHERLFKLLDIREFDEIRVIVPESQSSRSRVAAYAAEILCQNYTNATVVRVDSHSVSKLFAALDREYLEMYEKHGLNVEIGLTGSKTQAIATAILAATRKLAQAWYVKPAIFDENRFTKGEGTLRSYDIRL